ncbi:MAG: UPF0149 family protein [Thiotrichales bacterium]
MMNSARLALTDEELDALDAWLLDEAMPESSMDLASLDGFFAALALNPASIAAEDWLGWVWDRAHATALPAFASEIEVHRGMELLLRHYDAVVQAIVGDAKYEPVLDIEPDGPGGERYDAGGWCAGFILGLNAFYEPYWARASAERVEMLAPMLLLGTTDGLATLGRHPNPDLAMQGAVAAIPVAIRDLNAYFAPLRDEASAVPSRRAAAKTGRNELCPCGSGKKFKKCCGGDA